MPIFDPTAGSSRPAPAATRRPPQRLIARLLAMAGAVAVALSTLVVDISDHGALAASSGAASSGTVKGRPKVGLVLSGGGALGATHIGVLKVLEEMRVPVDIITGTSMGSIVGGLYAMGLSARELEGLVATIDWAKTLTDEPPRADRTFRSKAEDYGFLIDMKVGIKDGGPQLPKGIIQGQRLTLMLRALTLRARGVTHFDQLPIKFRAVAADLETGQAVVLDRGNLASAMRASMSVPGVFPPVEIGDKLLVDGGVANNLPVELARQMGADVLIVVDIPSVLKKRDELKSSLDIAGQMLTVLIQQNSLIQMSKMKPQDIMVRPDLGKMSAADFGRIMDAVPPGEAAARQTADKLKALSLSPADWTKYKATHTRPPMETPEIAFIEVENRTKLSDERIKGQLRQKTGEPLDVAKVEDDFTRLYGMGDFEQVDYQLVERDGKTGMVVTATEKAWAKDYVRAGLALEHDLEGRSTYSVGGGLTLTALNSYGAEFRAALAIGSSHQFTAEFYQPLQPEPGWFASVMTRYNRNDVTAWSGDQRVAEYRVGMGDLAFFIGRELSNIGEIRVGYRAGIGGLDRRIGLTGPDNFDFNVGEAVAQLSIDTLDDVGFPSDGDLLAVNLVHSSTSLGGDEDYTRLHVVGNHAMSFGKNRVIIGVEGGTALEGDLPLYDRFATGGMFRLSGYARDELSTANLLMGRLIYMRALSDTSPLAFELPLYVGGSIEGGLIDGDVNGDELGRRVLGGSVFAGADTPLGPVYAGYGHADGGRQNVYIYFGKLF